MKLKTLITIGHGAYVGANSLRHCTSKKRAMEELLYRGVSKAEAKRAIDTVLSSFYGYTTVSTANTISSIEVRNSLERATVNHWTILTYKNKGLIEQEYSRADR